MENQPVVLGGVDTRSSGGVVLPEGVSAARLDEEGRIAIDLDCIGCQYNLRMCDAQGRCPECGLAVGRYLCYHEPKWVQCLAWGMNRFAVALLAVVVGGLMVILLGVTPDEIYKLPAILEVIYFLAIVLLCVAIPFALLGFVRSTTPEGSPAIPARWFSPRFATRLIFTVGFFTPFLIPATESLNQNIYYSGHHWATSIVLLITSLAWLAVPVCLLLHARQLATMIPRQKLAWWTLLILLAVGGSGVAVIGLMDNWFGWYDAVLPYYESAWPMYSNVGPSQAYLYYSWTPGMPWNYHDGFVETLDWARAVSWGLFGLSVLGIVPLFFVYWSALHKEAAKAKATWAASPWRGKGEEAAGQLNASMQRGVRAEP